MNKLKKDKCEICGEDLLYASTQESYRDLECYFCKSQFHTNIYCSNDHYICDRCHSEEPIKLIEKFSITTELKDPFKIAEKIMAHPSFKMYGPEHHALTPVAILTSLKNNNITKPDGSKISVNDIKEAIKRASKIPGGWCGFYGSCGAGMGSGIALSIFTGANPSKDIPRSIANEMTSRSLSKISDNLEHCCKRSVRLSICEALTLISEKFNLTLDYKPHSCEFSKINPRCSGTKCPIY